ncbi:transposase [uncultured Alistipes sp.]|uniref:transposase n=1 Tax=uncultured Alistipes sp. TaxID=538949 RepID=UPI0025F01F1E|nr:transposase [uncultured Alistipes sp.]
MTLLYRITRSETLRDLKADLKAIHDVGIQIESVTCDGAPNIIKAVREVCPEAILQRCTVHVAREIETWITRKPQTVAAQELLELVHLLNGVQTHDEAQLWIRAFVDWHRQHEPFINEKTVDEESGRWWFTHKRCPATIFLKGLICSNGRISCLAEIHPQIHRQPQSFEVAQELFGTLQILEQHVASPRTIRHKIFN